MVNRIYYLQALSAAVNLFALDMQLFPVQDQLGIFNADGYIWKMLHASLKLHF